MNDARPPHPNGAFIHWMDTVNGLMLRRWGLHSEDLPDSADYPYYSMYEDGLSPKDAVQLIAEENDAP